MTKEEFKQYSELQEKFAKDVARVIGFLKEIDEDLKFVNEFQLLDGGSVQTHGWEYWKLPPCWFRIPYCWWDRLKLHGH